MTKAEQSLSRLFTVALIGATTLSTCGLRLDAGRTLLQGHAFDRGPPLMRSGSMARVDAVGDGLRSNWD